MTSSYYEYSDMEIDQEVVTDSDGEKLVSQGDGSWPRVTNEEAVKNSIINIINTMKGSRRMLPEFATNIYSMLFEPIDERTASSIRSIFVDSIKRWDDRVEIDKFSVVPNYDENLYKCLLSYRIKGSRELRTLNWVFRRL